jgi:HEPN domain-containing protein
MAQDPDATHQVPQELYDRVTATAKVKAAEELPRWVESLIRS